jgi:protein TonB
MYYLETGRNTHTQFRNAIALALAVHAALILTVSFSASNLRPYSTPQIEVALANQPSTRSPEDARKIAQADQEGSGAEAETNPINRRNNVPFFQYSQQPPVVQVLQDQLMQQRDMLTSSAIAAATQTINATKPPQQAVSLAGISPEVDRLSAELASLQTELDHQTSYYADQLRVGGLSAASAKKSVDAAYLLGWQQRLETVGNHYYPQASVRYGLYGNLRMLVVIRQDGSLEDIEILSSSGYAVLDEAAITIVRMAAPYAPFPPELRANTDKLEIVRTWHFRENPLSSP